MNIVEFMPDTEEFFLTRKMLRDVDFHMDLRHLTAVCNNETEETYLRIMAMASILAHINDTFSRKYQSMDILRTNSPEAIKIIGGGSSLGPAKIQPWYTFDTFIAGESNKEAFMAAEKVSRLQTLRDTGSNFLFLYGGVGLGKTHLLHAVLNVLLSRGKRILLFEGHEFVDYIIKAVNQIGGDYTTLMDIFHQCDVLAIDDIYYLDPKKMKRSEREFKGVLDILITEGKFGLFTSKFCPPDERWDILPDIGTRLVQGYTVDVRPPDHQLRSDLFEAELRKFGIEIPAETLAFLSQPEIQDVRTIQGICKSIAHKKDMHIPLTIDVADTLLKRAKIAVRSHDEAMVAKAMEHLHKVYSLQELSQPKLPRELSRIRNQVIYQIYSEVHLSQSSIARAFGLTNQRISSIVTAERKRQ